MIKIPISCAAGIEGQRVLVTGASGGIGQATVRTLAQAGALVMATDLNESNPFFDVPQVEYLPYDVTSEEQTVHVITETKKKMGGIDSTVLCAGIITNTSLSEASLEEWDRIWRVNVIGMVNPLRLVFPMMCEQGHGKIVAVGSIAAKVGGLVAGPAYVATKSAIHGMIKWTARAGAAHGVYANVVAPGPVETNLFLEASNGTLPPPDGIPLGRFGKPEDVAEGIRFLCSPASNWITGASLDINGGMFMG